MFLAPIFYHFDIRPPKTNGWQLKIGILWKKWRFRTLEKHHFVSVQPFFFLGECLVAKMVVSNWLESLGGL